MKTLVACLLSALTISCSSINPNGMNLASKQLMKENKELKVMNQALGETIYSLADDYIKLQETSIKNGTSVRKIAYAAFALGYQKGIIDTLKLTNPEKEFYPTRAIYFPDDKSPVYKEAN